MPVRRYSTRYQGTRYQVPVPGTRKNTKLEKPETVVAGRLSVVTAWQDSSKERLVKLHVFLVFQVLTTMPLVRLVARAVVRTNTLTTHCKLHAKTAALASTHQQEHPRATNVPRVSTEERTTLLV